MKLKRDHHLPYFAETIKNMFKDIDRNKKDEILIGMPFSSPFHHYFIIFTYF